VRTGSRERLLFNFSVLLLVIFRWHFLWIKPALFMFISFCLSFCDSMSCFHLLLYFHWYFSEKIEREARIGADNQMPF
jgi:hypothetical protein